MTGGMPTEQAVAHGIRATAGVVTSAAVIMVAVFAVFGTLSLMDFKQLSVGLAVAVLLDATVVRGVLLPSVMALLGDRNWYLPRWLSRLPKLCRTGRPWRPPVHARARAPACHPRHARWYTRLTRSSITTRAVPATRPIVPAARRPTWRWRAWTGRRPATAGRCAHLAGRRSQCPWPACAGCC